MPRAAPYGWPVEPFDRQHPVRGYFSDPRDGEKRSTFHFGIDVAVPDGTPVFSVEAGTVDMGEGAENVAVVSTGGSRTFGYWHVIPVVKHKQQVAKHELLGQTGRDREPVAVDRLKAVDVDAAAQDRDEPLAIARL